MAFDAKQSTAFVGAVNSGTHLGKPLKRSELMPKSRQYFRHSVSTNVAVVVIGFVSFSASIVRAGSITYNLIDYGNYDSNSYTLHGSITTDGVLGQLSATDITAWNINLEQAGSSA